MRPPDEQDIWDVISSQTVNIQQLTKIVQKHSKELEVLHTAYIQQEANIEQLIYKIKKMEQNQKGDTK